MCVSNCFDLQLWLVCHAASRPVSRHSCHSMSCTVFHLVSRHVCFLVSQTLFLVACQCVGNAFGLHYCKSVSFCFLTASRSPIKFVCLQMPWLPPLIAWQSLCQRALRRLRRPVFCQRSCFSPLTAWRPAINVVTSFMSSQLSWLSPLLGWQPARPKMPHPSHRAECRRVFWPSPLLGFGASF